MTAVDLHRLKQIELATLLGLSPRQINNLAKQGYPGVLNDDGKTVYDGPIFIAAYWQRRIEELEAKHAEKKQLDPLDRLNLARAKKEELDLAERERLLVSSDYMAEQLERIAMAFKQAIENLPARYAPKMLGIKLVAEAQARLEKMTFEALTRLAEVGSNPALDQDSDAAA